MQEANQQEEEQHLLTLPKPIEEAGGSQKREIAQGLQAPVSQENQVTDLILSQPIIEVAETTRKDQIETEEFTAEINNL